MQKDSLVIFKNRPARVTAVDDKKIEITQSDGRCIKLPAKNVLLLHAGGFCDFDVLTKPDDGELLEAWQLLEGQKSDYSELSELIYGEFTPKTAYATWQLVSDGVYFTATQEAVVVHSKAQVMDIQRKRAEKKAKENAISDFVSRLREQCFFPEDTPFMKEIAALALGKSASCRFLKLLQIEATAQNAHQLLLETGYWDEFVNPYPARFEAPLNPPNLPVLDLPEETRVDLTDLPAFAIDDEDSNDPDDAVSFDEKTHRIWVHVADPGAIVSPGSVLDLEARARGNNLYLPEGVVPMLPFAVTENLALGLKSVAPALSIGFHLSETGEIEDIQLCLSRVKVTRLSYEAADALLTKPPLKQLAESAACFREVRQRNGAVELRFPEVKLSLSERKVQIKTPKALQSRAVIKEAMLMAGVAVARFAEDNRIPLPFSTQDVHDLAQDECVPRQFSQMFQVRKRLQKRRYKSTPDRHAGIGLDAYVQVTSPLRRYLDLQVHQQLRAFLKQKKLLSADDILTGIAESEAGMKAARQAESFSKAHWKCVYLLQNPNWEGEAMVIEKGQNSRVSVFIPSLVLTKRLLLSQSVQLDEKIQLKLSSVSLAAQALYFKVL